VTRVESRNPATGEVLLQAPGAGEEAVGRAVAAARAAAPAWARTPVAQRAAALRRFAGLLEADPEPLAALITAEVGKLRADADGEVAWTALTARWYADHPPAAEQVGGALVVRRPLGVVAAITPWNVPLVTPAWKWLPALMAGNAVIWKPSELASATAIAAHERLREAGLPPGIIQVLPGDGQTGRALCEHPGVDGILFTGSTAVGKAIAAVASRRVARVGLELGGINPAIVFADADLDLAAACVAGCATALNGQKCTSTRRVLVEAPVYDAVAARLQARFEALELGNPAAPETTLGPLITPEARERSEAAIAGALAAGARVLAATPRPTGLQGDAFLPATLLADLPRDHELRRTELFAPVLQLEAFATPEEAWQEANATQYGLSASLFTRDPERAREGVERLQAGVVTVNRRGDDVELEPPFGGAKQSGNGFAEGGAYAYAAVTDAQAAYGLSSAA